MRPALSRSNLNSSRFGPDLLIWAPIATKRAPAIAQPSRDVRRVRLLSANHGLSGHGDTMHALRRTVAETGEPLRSERRRSWRIGLVEDIGRDDTVEAERAEILTQFAPGGKQSCGVEIADRYRPDDALADPVPLVAIGETDLAAAADGGA